MRTTLIFAMLFAAAPAWAQASSTPLSSAPCDPSLWQHVYHPARLQVRQQCVSVSGVIVDATHGKRKDGVRHEKDGDTHGWLKLDSNILSSKYLNAGNRSAEGGNLVFEVVCKFRVTQKDAIAACRGYKSPIVIPPVGTRVCITGSLVQDQMHAKWMELHPVTSITKGSC